jgi:predicted nucleic acid-binding protein
VRVVLDTSVLIGASVVPSGLEVAVSAVSIGELHFGLLSTDDPDERAVRAARLGAIEARFRPLPFDDDVARAWGALQARVRRRGAQPRSRVADLMIAATAQVHGAVLLTHNEEDFRHVADVVRVARPGDLTPDGV